jgi:ankyrin repeat protein
MENREAGIYRLFIILAIFSASILFLNSHKKSSITATHIDVLNVSTDSVVGLSLDQAYEHMSSLLKSHDTDLIVKIIHQFIHHFAVELVEKIIKDTALSLSNEEKLEILFGTVLHCNGKKAVQYRLLDFLLDYPSLYQEIPVLISLARSKYTDTIAIFINWGKERQKEQAREGLLQTFVNHAFTVAIQENDYNSCEVLLSKKVRIEAPKASELLWHIVENNKNSAFVSLLVHHSHADVNSVGDGKTLLIAAVEHNNTKMVQVLLDEGAVVDRVVDPEKGTALEIAMARNYSSTEQLLREYGA